MIFRVYFLLMCLLVQSSIAISFESRRDFHDRLCKKRPELSTCRRAFTEGDYQRELQKYGPLDVKNLDSNLKNDHKRQAWANDDDDYEYYMWRKYQREMHKRKYERLSSSSDEHVVKHIHYHVPQYTYRQPTYQYQYPSYSYYPNYGYGGGYSGGYGGGYGSGGIFNMGFGRQLGIMTPIGGFGISSGFGIGIGK